MMGADDLLIELAAAAGAWAARKIAERQAAEKADRDKADKIADEVKAELAADRAADEHATASPHPETAATSIAAAINAPPRAP